MFGFKKKSSPDASPTKSETEPEAGLLAKLRQRLGKTRANLSTGLGNLFRDRARIDEDLLEELETLLLMADVGVDTTRDILDRLTQEATQKAPDSGEDLYRLLENILLEILTPCCQPLKIESESNPFVILMVGINGAGKTTSIGKLASQFKDQGKSVMLAAGDTFRAAAVEQLQSWGERNEIPVISQHSGADSASVIYDAIESARARNIDVLIADTAGRLHTKSNLMDELKKIKRVMQKIDARIPQEIMLVIDASTGQNALTQAAEFNKAINVTGITLSKLDGTAKGGIIFAIANQLGLPIRFIGVGESIEDLRTFDASEFITALLENQE